jgi:undecaprenyl-diphosphatase
MAPISYFQAVVLGLLQGLSELFPISSLGHSVVMPRLLGWDIHQNDDAERQRQRASVRSRAGLQSDAIIARTLDFRQALGVGSAHASALIPGLSRSGASMGGGLLVGLSNEEAARFAFLLATPIIGTAGVLKLPDLLGSQGDQVRGQALVGALRVAVTAYLSIRFRLRYFKTNRLTLFAIYCLAVGVALSIGFALT